MPSDYILRQMVRVSNNSQITNIVAKILSEKLDAVEMRNFEEWLKIVQREKDNSGHSRSPFGRY
jgi:hypothetical protein